MPDFYGDVRRMVAAYGWFKLLYPFRHVFYTIMLMAFVYLAYTMHTTKIWKVETRPNTEYSTPDFLHEFRNLTMTRNLQTVSIDSRLRLKNTQDIILHHIVILTQLYDCPTSRAPNAFVGDCVGFYNKSSLITTTVEPHGVFTQRFHLTTDEIDLSSIRNIVPVVKVVEVDGAAT